MIRTKAIYEELEQCTDENKRLELLFELTTALLNFDEKRSLQVAEEIKELSEQLDSNLGRSYYHSALGRVFFKKSQFPEATTAFKKALETAMQTDDQVMQGICLDTLGVVYNQQNKCAKAIELSTQALLIFEKLPNTSRYQIVCYNNIGNTYKKLDEFAQAEETYLLALKLAEADDDNRMRANILNNLGAINIVQGNHKVAKRYVEQAMAIFKSISHKHGEVHAMVFVGHCNFALGNYAKAMDDYLNGLKLLKQVDHKPIEAQAYKGLGDVYHKLEAYPEALKHYQKALTIATSIEDHIDVCDLYQSISSTYLKMDNKSAAKKAIQEGKELAVTEALEHKLAELEKYEQEHF